MSLRGKGIVAIWNDIRWEGRETFYRWHDEEHVPERVAVDGFLRGRRYVRVEAEVEWFTLYETETAAVLRSPAYLERLNDPTPRTREAVRYFHNVTRGLAEVRFTSGVADGGNLLVAGYAVEGDPGRVAAALEPVVADILSGVTGICAAHLCVADREASGVATAERQARAGGTDVPDIVVMLESGWEKWLRAAADHLSQTTGEVPGLEPLRPPGLYRLEFGLSRD